MSAHHKQEHFCQQNIMFLSGGTQPAYASCVKAAFSLLTTRGRLLWLYRNMCFMC